MNWIKIVVLTLLAAAVAAAGIGAMVVFLGLYNVSAKLGHLPGVGWALHTTFRNSVELYADEDAPVPSLDADRVALGARHFDTACRFCHARPGERRNATAQRINPVPPHILTAVEDWTPQEFHWIVYEGVKMSGMPAWPAEREDEVWALVAFLEALPEIDGPDYERMISAKVPEKAQLAAVDNAAAGPLAEAGEDVPGLAYCATCHGISGASDNRYIPRLDIQNAPYLENSLEAYHTGARQSGIMAQAVTMVPPEALPKLAEHYARQPTAGAAAREPAELALVDVGRDLAQAKPADRDIPACSSCHGPGADRREAGFPSLSGQHREYLEAQLHLWRTGNRGGGEKANLMKQAAQELTDADIKALAAYYASLAPARMPPVKTVVD